MQFVTGSFLLWLRRGRDGERSEVEFMEHLKVKAHSSVLDGSIR